MGTERVLQSLRGYFLGVTIVAVFNAVVVGSARDPRRAAGRHDRHRHVPRRLHPVPRRLERRRSPSWSRSAAPGTDAAIGMAVIQLLANGVLQQLVQPIAYGAALGIHPLAVLIVTIAGGALFGAAGLILAAPAHLGATRIAADLARGDPEAQAPDATTA